MLFKAIIAGVMTLAVIGTAGQIIFPPNPVLFYNPSESAKVGWYRLKPDEPVVLGSQVAAYAPKWARKLADERGYLPYDYPLIKTVWAVQGDEVCYNTQSVSVPKRSDIPVFKIRAVLSSDRVSLCCCRPMCRRGLIVGILGQSAAKIFWEWWNIWKNLRILKGLKSLYLWGLEGEFKRAR